MTVRGHPCITWGGAGAVLGLAASAWAQTGDMVSVVPLDPSTRLLVELVGAGGLPAALGALGWLLARTLATWQPRIEVVHRWPDDDGDPITALRALRRELAEVRDQLAQAGGDT